MFEKYLLNKISFYLSFVFIFSACYLEKSVDLELNDVSWNNPENSLKIWTLSDIQPKDQKQRKEFERAVLDINENVPDIDFAIVAGDILQEVSEEGFDWYIRTRNLSYIKKWYEILGNHDLNPDNDKLYQKKIRKDFHYSKGKHSCYIYVGRG